MFGVESLKLKKQHNESMKMIVLWDKFVLHVINTSFFLNGDAARSTVE